MPVKSATPHVTPKATAKPAHATAAKPRTKTKAMSNLETRRLESFKALMIKYGGKLPFAAYED